MSASEIGGVCFTIITVLAIVIGGSLAYCNALDRLHYDTVKQCTERGGTWIPTRDYNGACVHPRS